MARRPCAVLIASALAFVLADNAHGATIRVPGEHTTIQAAIDSSVGGDIVLVAPGVYMESIDFLGKPIEVVSESGPGMTILDGGNKDVVVTIAGREDRGALLQGFTIRNGGFDPDNYGNSQGQGVRISGSSPRIIGNHIADNGGWGISSYWGSPMIGRNRIERNSQGGIQIRARDERGILPDIRFNTISDNLWGGIFLGSEATVEGNIITGNLSYSGGGIEVVGVSPARIVQNIIAGNRALRGGGGISVSTISSAGAGPRVVNNTVVGNISPDGSALLVRPWEDMEFINNIFVASPGESAVHCVQRAFDQGIFRSNDVFSPSGARFSGACPDITGMDGNIGDDPGLACLPGGDYALDPTSACVDAGEAGIPYLPSEDTAGNSRVTDGNIDGIARVDIGATEFQPEMAAARCAYAVCPAPLLALVERGERACKVDYSSPWSAPDSTEVCLPSSGSSFFVGETPVRCTVTSPVGDTASCAFTVTVDVRAPNDDFNEATPISTLPFTDSLYTGTATVAQDDPYCFSFGPTVWYSLTLNSNVWVTLDASRSDYPTALSVHTGTREALTPVVCNDGPVQFLAAAGEHYSIMVGAKPPSSSYGGHLDFSVNGVPGMNVEVSAASVGRIAAEPGDVALHGKVSCTYPGEVDLFAYLVQERGRTRTEALSQLHLPCGLASEWSLDIPSPESPFRAGWATLYLFAVAERDGTTESAYADTSGPIQLKGSSGRPGSQDGSQQRVVPSPM